MENTHKDYCEKINGKLDNYSEDDISSIDINNLIVLLNFCFYTKNNFFIENFNKKSIRNVYLGYNQLKTNILTPSITDILNGLNEDNIKILRFITINFVNNYEKIMNDIINESCLEISKDSIKRCLHFFTKVLNHQ